MKKMNKKYLLVFTILLSFLCLFTFTACSKKYKVSFVVDDKTVETVEVKKGKNVSKISDPVKENYAFEGWYNGETLFDFTTPIKQDYTLKAKFEQDTFMVYFAADDDIIDGIKVKRNEKVTPIADPVKEGNKFTGWYNGNTLFDFNTPITQDYYLKAKFTDNTFTIHFVVDDATTKTIEVEENETITPIADPVKENYAFIGWYNGDELFDFNTPITQDYTLKAKFEQDTFTIHFSVDDTIVDSKKAKKNEKVTPIAEPIKTGSKFTGWYSEETLFDFNTPITKDYHLVAKFHVLPISVSITCDTTSLYVGETLQLHATVTPSEASQEVKWSVTNTKGAESQIDQNGLLTVSNPGEVYVYANSTDITYISGYIKITVLHTLLDEEIYDAFNIMTGFGTDASTQIEINYHTHNLQTNVEYTLASDVNFANASICEPASGYYFTNGDEAVEFQFDPRNVMRVSLSNLQPDTEYIYRINKGDGTYSETYKFKTAKNDGSKTSFLAMSDIHYWAVLDEETGEYKSHGSEISEVIINKAMERNPNIGFIATAGDIVDRGGSPQTWEQFFKWSNSLKYLPRVSVAGNHEYYYSGTGQTDYKYQKAHSATPYNGPSSHIGVSGYTVYNDVLFIVFDNEKSVDRDIQLAWLENVLETVEAKYTIIMMHHPIYYPAEGPNATDRDEELMGILEKYCVDLAISGHYHGNNWNPDYYEGAPSTDSGLGVNYITLSFGGVKSMSDTNRPTGYIFDIENGIIQITRINDAGDVVNTYSIKTKKYQEVVPETKDNLIDSIGEWTYNANKNRAEISVSDKFYGNVDKVVVTELLRGKTNETFYFPTPSYNKLFISGIKEYHDYLFRITIYFNDGTTHQVDKLFKYGVDIHLEATNISSNSVTLNFEGNDDLLFTISKYVVYVNGVEYGTFSYSENYQCVTSYVINNLMANTDYTIELRAINTRKEVVYTNTIDVKTTE